MKIPTILIWLFCAAACFGVYAIEPDDSLLPIMTLVIACFTATVLLRRRAFFRSGRAIAIGRKPLTHPVHLIVFGTSLAFIIYGLASPDPNENWMGISWQVFTGLMFICIELLETGKYLFVLEEECIMMTSMGFRSDRWKYNEVGEVAMNGEEVVFKNVGGYYITYRSRFDDATRHEVERLMTSKGVAFSHDPDNI